MNVSDLVGLLAISSRGEPVGLLEISYEVAFVVNSHQRHYVFEAQERSVKQILRTLKTKAFEVLCGRQAGLVFEQVPQARR